MDQGYSSNNANGEEEGKPRSILNKEMAEAGNFNIKNRIKVFCDRHPNVVIDNNKLTDDIYEYIATNTNGNISSIINIITCFLSTYEWREGLSDYFATIEYETFKENQTVKQLKKMGPQPKLYI